MAGRGVFHSVVPPEYYPLILYAVMFCYMLCPLDIFYRVCPQYPPSLSFGRPSSSSSSSCCCCCCYCYCYWYLLLVFVGSFRTLCHTNTQKSARFWLLRKIFRIISAPWAVVEFPDFFLADLITSLTSMLYDWQFALCYYSADVWRPGCTFVVRDGARPHPLTHSRVDWPTYR